MYMNLVFLLVLFSNSNSEPVLKQILLLSRHNVRTPLSKNLALTTPKQWPTWKDKRGYLTAKGELLEGYMGEFFTKWLQQKGLLDKECPTEDRFYVYSNTAERTLASAKAFVDKGFPNCNITVHHSADKDPIFEPVIHNSSLVFKQEALDNMRESLKSLDLNDSYRILEQLLDYSKSKLCTEQGYCDMITDKNQPFISVGFKPYVSGPLKISKSVIDSFIMEYYEGFPLNKVAWGELRTEQQWDAILGLSKSYHKIIFNFPLISKDIAKPLINSISSFLLPDTTPKVVLMMGHDANIYTLLSALSFKSHSLNNQHEPVPAGGKIVFQKWWDNAKSSFLLRIDYVYQSTKGMREGVKLDLKNPPEFTRLELNGCQNDKDGFCDWNNFKNILDKFSENKSKS